MEAVYPAGASALTRGRRRPRRADPRARRTTPVTFAEIKEVDEEGEDACGVGAGAGGEAAGVLERRRRGRRDELLADPEPPAPVCALGTQFTEFRRRRERARRDVLRERAEEPPCPPRAASEPRHCPVEPSGSAPPTHSTTSTES